jgi:alcohol dehydrogenase
VPFADGMLVPLPEGVDPAAAASVADNVSDAYRHIGPHVDVIGGEGRSSEVLIMGSPVRRTLFTASVPLYTALIARALGAERVTLADARPAVRAEAASLGIDAVGYGELGGPATAPLVADISAHPKGLRKAIEMTAADGVCSSSGGLHKNVTLPFSSMYGHNVTLRVARANARALIPDVLDLMASGRLQPERVTTQLAPIDEAIPALGVHMRGGSTKTILVDA